VQEDRERAEWCFKPRIWSLLIIPNRVEKSAVIVKEKKAKPKIKPIKKPL